jgi:hypothetical protein
MNYDNPKHAVSARRTRATYYADGTRSDGAKWLRVNPNVSRSKYVPHVGKKQLAKAA